MVASFQRDASVEIIDRNGSVKIETTGQVGIMNDSEEITTKASELTLKNQQKYDYLVEQIKYVRNVEILKNRNIIENLQGSFPEDDVEPALESKF